MAGPSTTMNPWEEGEGLLPGDDGSGDITSQYLYSLLLVLLADDI